MTVGGETETNEIFNPKIINSSTEDDEIQNNKNESPEKYTKDS